VAFSHREVDLAMTHLFGGFQEGFYRSYSESFPLETGFAKRIGLYNLYPLLVHLRLFGYSYYAEIKSILNPFRR
jgi:protein-ribulosamine 3-kinase